MVLWLRLCIRVASVCLRLSPSLSISICVYFLQCQCRAVTACLCEGCCERVLRFFSVIHFSHTSKSILRPPRPAPLSGRCDWPQSFCPIPLHGPPDKSEQVHGLSPRRTTTPYSAGSRSVACPRPNAASCASRQRPTWPAICPSICATPHCPLAPRRRRLEFLPCCRLARPCKSNGNTGGCGGSTSRTSTEWQNSALSVLIIMVTALWPRGCPVKPPIVVFCSPSRPTVANLWIRSFVHCLPRSTPRAQRLTPVQRASVIKLISHKAVQESRVWKLTAST